MMNTPRKNEKLKERKTGNAPKASKPKKSGKSAQESPRKQTEEKLRGTSAAYDAAIKNYEAYYQRQRTDPYYYWSHYQYPYYTYYSPRYYTPGYKAYSQMPGGAEYDQALREYEQGFQAIEQAMVDYQTVQEYLSELENQDRQDYLQGWKDYLEGLLEFSKQQTKSLEESIQNLK
jgi:hypothetical protein